MWASGSKHLNFQGTGPWNIEFQIIGPNEPETFRVSDIDTPKKRVQIPIPEELRKNGGQFEINLRKPEDAYNPRYEVDAAL